MRVFALTSLFGLIVLNCLLSYSGQALAQEVHLVVVHDHLELSALSKAAFALQPWFYAVAVAVFVVMALGFRHKLSDQRLIYAVVSFFVLDVIGLVISLWGFGVVHFLL